MAQTSLTEFFRPCDPDGLGIVAAARALLDRDAPGSAGEITSPLLLDRGMPVPEGALSEVIFGPLRDYACACAKLCGRAHQGQRCDRCHVECTLTAVRAERQGHICLAQPMVHPELVPLIAGCLELTAEQVWAVAYFRAVLRGERPELQGDPERVAEHLADHPGESGAQALLARLAAAPRGPRSAQLERAGFAPSELILGVLAVIPPAQRPLIPMPGGALLPDAISARYQQIVGLNELLRRISDPRERAAGGAIAYACRLQAQIEALCRHLGARDPRPGRRSLSLPGFSFDPASCLLYSESQVCTAPAPPSVPAVPDAADGPPIEAVAACALLGRDELLVQLESGRWAVFARAHGTLRRFLDLDPGQLTWLGEDSRYATFASYDETYLIDLASGCAAAETSAAAPLDLTADYGEQVCLIRAREGGVVLLFDLAGRPYRRAYSPEGSWVWIEDGAGYGGVYGFASGLRVFDPHVLTDPVRAAGPVRTLMLHQPHSAPPRPAGSTGMPLKRRRTRSRRRPMGARWRSCSTAPAAGGASASRPCGSARSPKPGSPSGLTRPPSAAAATSCCCSADVASGSSVTSKGTRGPSPAACSI